MIEVRLWVEMLGKVAAGNPFAIKSIRANGAGFVDVTSIQELTAYLNTGHDRQQSPIEHLSLYSHGVPQRVAFGYELPADEAMSLNVLNYTQISPSAFLAMAQIDSYACRTGMGNRPDWLVEEVVQFYPQTNESLAQLLANHLRLKVRAYIRRSEKLFVAAHEEFRLARMGQIDAR